MDDLIMIIGAGVFQVPSILKAQEMGFKVLAIDMSLDAPGVEIADFFEAVSTRDIEQAIIIAKRYSSKYNLKAVFTAGTDVSVTVASIAAALDLPGISVETAMNATNKFLMRKRLKAFGVRCPKFFKALNLEEAIIKAKTLGYPLVIKPIDNMGARGVRRIDNEEDLKEQFQLSISHSGNYNETAVIIEEFMDGEEISMDTLVDHDGNVYLLTVADRHIKFPPYFVEIGHTIPSRLSKEKIDDAFSVMKDAIKAIGIKGNAAKADIKITSSGAKIGEITARMSGGFHSQCTDPLATGMDSIKAAIKIALGEKIDIEAITPRICRYAIERAIMPRPGKITEISGINEAKLVDGVYDVFMSLRVGDIVEELKSNIGKAGHIIAYGDSLEEAEAASSKATQIININTI